MNNASVSDQALWQRVLDGDGRSFGTLFERHRDRVFRHIGRLGIEAAEAEDLTATVFFELWRRRARTLTVNDSLLPWLLATATKAARDTARARRRHRRLLGLLPQATAAADRARFTEDRAELRSHAAGITESVRSLSLVDQQLLFLVILEGLSVEDAGHAVGVSYGTARTQLSRVRQRLVHATTALTLQGVRL